MFLSTVHRTMTAMGFLVCRFGRFYVQFVCCLYCSLYQPTVAANVTRQQKKRVRVRMYACVLRGRSWNYLG